MDSKDALEVYKACLQHTLKLIISFISFFSILCLLFGYYIYKSYDVVPATITATQGMKAASKAQKPDCGQGACLLCPRCARGNRIWPTAFSDAG